MRKTYFVSFPRSGHHMVVNVLKDILDDKLKYCERYKNPEKMIENCSETNLQKDHDFDLTLPIKDEFQYLVLIRHPVPAIMSWYEMPRPYEKESSFEEFFAEKIKFYGEFLKKWVIPQRENIRVFDYNNILDHPEVSIDNIIWFLTGDEELVWEDKTIEVLSKKPIKPRNKTIDLNFDQYRLGRYKIISK